MCFVISTTNGTACMSVCTTLHTWPQGTAMMIIQGSNLHVESFRSSPQHARDDAKEADDALLGWSFRSDETDENTEKRRFGARVEPTVKKLN